VSGALAAVTLNLVSAAPGIPVLLTVGADTARATQAVNAFVASYNTVTGAINSQFSFDPVANLIMAQITGQLASLPVGHL